jgi:plastocyanin
VGSIVSLAAGAAAAGELSGKVTYAGPPPQAGKVEVPATQRACGQSIPDESLLVGKDGALRNAVVYLREVAPSTPDRAPLRVVLDQVGCRYTPHVLTARVGDELEVVNSDAVLHNVNAGTAFNYAFPMKGQKRVVPLKKATVLHTKCNAGHPWMSAYIHVLPHGFSTVTGEDGAFRLPKLPAGSHTLVVWHEKLGTRTQQVTVPAEGQAKVDFTLEPAAASAKTAP